jgi:hypothetical protein
LQKAVPLPKQYSEQTAVSNNEIENQKHRSSILIITSRAIMVIVINDFLTKQQPNFWQSKVLIQIKYC